MQITLRGLIHHAANDISKDGDASKVITDLLAIKEFPQHDPLIEWHKNDLDQLCALDVDGNLSLDHLEMLHNFPIQPLYIWLTHHEGLRGIYVASGNLTALERAAIASTAVARYGRVELNPRTRHPRFTRSDDGSECRCINPHHGGDADGAADRLLGDDETVDNEVIENWLTQHGMQMGRKEDHSRCPIAILPTPGHNNPVVPLDKGVYCHYCQSRGNGFRSWATLIDPALRHREPNRLRACVKHFTNWDHARHVMAARHPSLRDDVMKPMYRALLKLRHLTADNAEAMTTRINSVFTDNPVVRVVGGLWANAGTLEPHCGKGTAHIVASLPAASYLDDAGKLKLSKKTYGHLLETAPAAWLGYPELRPVRGVAAEGGRECLDVEREVIDDSTITVVMHSKPRFGDAGFMPLPDAERHIAGQFPGVDLNLLRLLIGAKFLVQLDPPEPPLLMLTGQSGASKTTHVILAANLCGDVVTGVKAQRNLQEFLSQVATAAGRGSFVLCDEITKGLADVDLTALLLAPRRGAQYRRLFIGPVQMPMMPVIVCADCVVPKVMVEEVQLARRVIGIDLGCGVNGTGKDWRQTCTGGDAGSWRAATRDNTRAADAFTLDVRQNLISRDFIELAGKLGFQSFRDQDESGMADYRAIFDAACAAPDDADRGKQFKRVVVGTPLHDAVQTLGDARGPETAQKLSGQQWGRVVGQPGVECDFVQREGRHPVIRFRDGPAKSPGTRFNAEIGGSNRILRAA